MRITKLATAAALLFGLTAQAAMAFPDGNINFVIPYNPGGGNDTVVRMIAPFMKKHLPKNVAVVPQNVSGAGGQRGASTVYRAATDGYTIGLFPMPGLALPKVLGKPSQYDLEKITWLGRIESSNYVLLVPAKSSIRSLKDFADGREITFISTGFGSTMLAASQITAGALGVKATFVTGYKGSRNAMAGLIRGDGNAAMGIIEPSASYIKSGDLRAIAVSARRPSLPNVPTFAELGHPALSVLSLDRWVGAPPKLDPKARKILEAALMGALNDPAFQAQAKKSGRVLAPLNGAAVKQLVGENLKFFDRFKKSLGNPAQQ